MHVRDIFFCFYYFVLWARIGAGLPNITGYFANGYRGVFNKFSGAFFVSSGWITFRDWGGEGPAWTYDGAEINASHASIIYGKSSTVTPLSLSSILVIKY